MAAADRYGQAYDYESITVSTTAIGLTATKVVPASGRPAFEAFLSVESQPVRYRIDGTDPTSSEGHLLASGDTVTITGTNNLKRLKLIRQGSSDGTVKVTFFR